jgi:phosphonate transport system substrate-binding protein
MSRRAFVTTLLAAGVGATFPARGTAPPLRFGITPVMLDDRIGFLNAWAAWLSAQLGRPVRFVQRARYREILDLLLRDQLDLAWICGYPYVQHQDRLTLIAVPTFQGQPLYRAYVIAGADTGIETLESLQDRLFAWSDPDSNSGYLYPRFYLSGAGRDPDRFFRRTFFTWGHPRSVMAVAEGLADGAAVDGYVWETLARRDPAMTDKTRVILRSPLFGFPPLVAAPNLPDAERVRLRAVLVGQTRDPVGRALLAELNLDGFSVAEPALFDDIAAMARQLNPRDHS